MLGVIRKKRKKLTFTTGPLFNMAEIVDRNNFPLLYNNEAINIDVAISGIISTLNSRDSIPPNIVNILDNRIVDLENDYRSFPESSNLDYDDDTTSSSSSGHDSSPEAKKQKLEVCLKAAKKEKYLNNVEKRLKIFIKDSPVSDFQKKCYIRSIIRALEFTVSEVSTFVVKRQPVSYPALNSRYDSKVNAV